MISISAKRRRNTGRNLPTPERLAKSDAPCRVGGGLTDALWRWRTRGMLEEQHVRAAAWFQQLAECALTGRSTGQPGRSGFRSGGAALTPFMPPSTAARLELEKIRSHLGDDDFALVSRALVDQARDVDVDRLRGALDVVGKKKWQRRPVSPTSLGDAR